MLKEIYNFCTKLFFIIYDVNINFDFSDNDIKNELAFEIFAES